MHRLNSFSTRQSAIGVALHTAPAARLARLVLSALTTLFHSDKSESLKVWQSIIGSYQIMTTPSQRSGKWEETGYAVSSE